MPESYEERRARRAARAAASAALNERDPEKLKHWYELAGDEIKKDPKTGKEILPDPSKELAEVARVIESQKKEDTPAPTGGGTGFSGGFDENTVVPEAGTAINVKSNRNLVPKLPLGKDKHREIYSVTEATRTAQSKGRETPTQEELDYHAKEWDTMPNDSKLSWQQSPHGKKATENAIAAANSTKVENANDVNVARLRSRQKVAALALGSSEAADKFKSTGELLDENGDPERDWRKPFDISKVTSMNKLASTRKGFQKEGVALHTDPQHHQALSDHIDELVNRSSSSAPAHLQGNQFNVKDGLANASKEALARSAMAHALGMKDAAISHFRAAVNHAGDLAQAVHGVNSQPLNDWDKQDGIQSRYVKSVNEAK
jgi:hypothetical protein